ncbi:glycosyltransferase family 4 protein [Actinopolymorpha rutila]|uniref:Glycosyltransferase involved in cell wall biosynthesis n=1 Tax=Actinopolymorpha rutila TaxID=446787 RepID=A0A852ZHM4_9ACTN|nr:glycosyltransferase family 4 protein [Actinopolymorpha rutila]NYH92424.1 glycosyltransferase involved in cell wall biosynthesis [Actinopolymorpha rutila]
MRRTVFVVLPGDIDDPTSPSGGNIYDRRICRGLEDPATAGWSVKELAAPGAWPDPDQEARDGLARRLAALPDGVAVLLDGLVGCAVPDLLAIQANRLRLAMLVHLPLGSEAGLPPRRAAELDALERQALHATRLVVATSPWTARHLADHHGIATSRIQVVTPGTDPAPPARGTDGRSRLLCVGAITRTKGQDLLVEALASLGSSGDTSWTCECVGPLHRDPTQVATVRGSIASHDLHQQVRLEGPRTGDRLAATYAAADLVIVPSRMETYGMVVTEALARGIPVVAADVGGVSSTLGQAPDGGIPGLLVPPGDVPALASALHRWLGDPALRQRLRSSARQSRGILSTWQATSRRMAHVLELLAGEPG